MLMDIEFLYISSADVSGVQCMRIAGKVCVVLVCVGMWVAE